MIGSSSILISLFLRFLTKYGCMYTSICGHIRVTLNTMNPRITTILAYLKMFFITNYIYLIFAFWCNKNGLKCIELFVDRMKFLILDLEDHSRAQTQQFPFEILFLFVNSNLSNFPVIVGTAAWIIELSMGDPHTSG